MSKKPLEYLRHIRDECEFLLHISEQISEKDELTTDETLKRAVVRSLEIIGKASKKVPTDFKVKPDVIKNKIPELVGQIREVIDNEDQIT